MLSILTQTKCILSRRNNSIWKGQNDTDTQEISSEKQSRKGANMNRKNCSLVSSSHIWSYSPWNGFMIEKLSWKNIFGIRKVLLQYISNWRSRSVKLDSSNFLIFNWWYSNIKLMYEKTLTPYNWLNRLSNTAGVETGIVNLIT